jgi:hypothetical protein
VGLFRHPGTSNLGEYVPCETSSDGFDGVPARLSEDRLLARVEIVTLFVSLCDYRPDVCSTSRHHAVLESF